MKRTLIAVVAIAALASFPAQAKAKIISTKTVTFKAVTPCFVACSYYVSPHDPTLPLENSFACSNPGPAGSYRDLVLTTPKGADFLRVVATPQVDWDLVLCTKPHHGNNGSLIAFEKQEGSPDPDNVEHACAVGCKDTIEQSVRAGRKYVLRAYSWLDPADLIAKITWSKGKLR